MGTWRSDRYYGSGKLVQIGKPEEVYLHPQNDFARDFLGISNRFTDIHGNTICCRPEELEFAAEGSVKGIVRQEEFLGFTDSIMLKQ